MAETSDDSAEDEYESVRSKREPKKKRKKDLTPGIKLTQLPTYFLKYTLFTSSQLFIYILISGLPEDTRYTMDQFLQGLDPEMTSTQQTQFTEDPSMVCLH